jgi:hypothetical protein
MRQFLSTPTIRTPVTVHGCTAAGSWSGPHRSNQAHLKQMVLLEPYRDAAAEEWAISHVQRHVGFSGVVAVTHRGVVAADTIEEQIILLNTCSSHSIQFKIGG